MEKISVTKIGGVRLTHLDLKSVVTDIDQRMAQKHYNQPLTVFTPNTEQLMQAKEIPAFLEVLNASTITVPDTTGLVWADWWRAFTTGRPWQVRDRVPGVDLAESLLLRAAKQGWKVVLIGGMGNSGSLAVDALKNRFSGLDIWEVSVGKVEMKDLDSKVSTKFRMDLSMENEEKIIKRINEIRPDLVLVGLGAPKQEVWVMKYGGMLHAQVLMVVGGAIDMWSGVQTRAPKWIRSLGGEWGWRLMKQPSRAHRQMRLVRFIGLVLTGKLFEV